MLGERIDVVLPHLWVYSILAGVGLALFPRLFIYLMVFDCWVEPVVIESLVTRLRAFMQAAFATVTNAPLALSLAVAVGIGFAVFLLAVYQSVSETIFAVIFATIVVGMLVWFAVNTLWYLIAVSFGIIFSLALALPAGCVIATIVSGLFTILLKRLVTPRRVIRFVGWAQVGLGLSQYLATSHLATSAWGGPPTGVDLGSHPGRCRPHSVLVRWRQRPARGSSPGRTAVVQGAQPIDG